jgi:hypothetical protein
VQQVTATGGDDVVDVVELLPSPSLR